jgi:hypothetical protein
LNDEATERGIYSASTTLRVSALKRTEVRAPKSLAAQEFVRQKEPAMLPKQEKKSVPVTDGSDRFLDLSEVAWR